jgi:hypothetical protein
LVSPAAPVSMQVLGKQRYVDPTEPRQTPMFVSDESAPLPADSAFDSRLPK